MTHLIVPTVGGVILFLLFAAFIISRIRTVSPGEALIISGAIRNGQPKVVLPGGRAFVIPIIHNAETVDLTQISIRDASSTPDKNKVEVVVTANVAFKVDNSEESIRAAAERFSGSGNFIESMKSNVQDIMRGALRAIISEMTVEEMISDRESLSRRTFEIAANDVRKMGIAIESFQITEINDNIGYIEALGRAEVERAKSDARKAVAITNAEATKIELENQTRIAEERRTTEVKMAQLKAESDRAKAESDAQGPLVQAEKAREIAILEAETAKARAELKERELDTEVRKPADAEQYRRQKEAEALRYEKEQQAEAARYQREKDADARAYETEKLAQADLDSSRKATDARVYDVSKVAEAELLSEQSRAAGIQAVGKAEAEALAERGRAYSEYGQATLVEKLVSQMPAIVSAAAEPMSSIENLSVVSTDGAGHLTKSVASTVAQANEIVRSQVGVDLSGLIGSFVGGVPVGGKVSD